MPTRQSISPFTNTLPGVRKKVTLGNETTEECLATSAIEKLMASGIDIKQTGTKILYS